ncbi:hypothetical protein BKA70DRAFT_1225576 [Coprinopsis sp. MPI-PUGE-AT-0042]|nr:hypothetical protein BKA70DRAFT_1225576 [Coprinopsis sp. MPI-PUGE-AT-0042]
MPTPTFQNHDSLGDDATNKFPLQVRHRGQDHFQYLNQLKSLLVQTMQAIGLSGRKPVSSLQANVLDRIIWKVQARSGNPEVRSACQCRWPVMSAIDQHAYEVHLLERAFRLDNGSSVTLPDFNLILLEEYQAAGGHLSDSE